MSVRFEDILPRAVTEVLDRQDKDWLRAARASDGESVIYLACCGTTDITQPYHSISYLAGALDESGHSYVVRDLAIEFWHYMMSTPVVEQLRAELVRRLDEETEEDSLLPLFIDVLKDSERFQRAFATLRDESAFYELPAYLNAVRDLSLLPRLLTLLSRSATYRTFSSASPPGAEDDRINLVTLRREIEAGFGIDVVDAFYDHHADRIAAMRPGLVGLTIPFISQLEHSLALAARLKQRGVSVAIGGPIAAKFYKYISDVTELKVLDFAVDYLVTGEGETLIKRLADHCQRGGELGDVNNLVDIRDPRPLKRFFFENVDALPSPNYGVWNYGLYASPQPGALYSPTRGCYWNKCSFCDYGLAMNAPTSPWRTRTPEHVIEDLQKASEHARHFFFAVDVLSPAYALKISDALIASDLSIKWMADFRLEKSFRTENTEIFARSGCLGAAFGMESTDQDVLNIINKGTEVQRLGSLVASFADAGIPVQLMGFTGHPGESRQQAQVTLDTAEAMLESVATVALGKFGLTPGADIARRPDHYGIDVHYDPSGDTAIPWELDWTHREPIDVYPEDDFDHSLRLIRGFPYPFLGATSTLHSLLYFERNPKAPFPIPQWGYSAAWRSFDIIPFYHAHEDDNGTTLLSGLTGRAVVLDAEQAALFAALFGRGGWLRINAKDGLSRKVRTLLDFLVKNSLAMFLPADTT
ncbi:B12-binding domain-containing radical SAM protein [Streptomyces sp. NPDC058221]|uniref:B12-binding domain-containing radical SAM protein n=1 Tax=Streptomyces sp. NPDC058221 TaxID=3346388 RepID=UPI0036EC84AD